MQIVAIIGLGYMGLPLAVEFGKKLRFIDVKSDLGVAMVADAGLTLWRL